MLTGGIVAVAYDQNSLLHGIRVLLMRIIPICQLEQQQDLMRGHFGH